MSSPVVSLRWEECSIHSKIVKRQLNRDVLDTKRQKRKGGFCVGIGPRRKATEQLTYLIIKQKHTTPQPFHEQQLPAQYGSEQVFRAQIKIILFFHTFLTKIAPK